ncbi:MAG: hypothetical protein K2I77_02475 [Anaeroplasmataceae bacterium]|nr:hypothetical protein [Anaeroplasmataceae bacterium]
MKNLCKNSGLLKRIFIVLLGLAVSIISIVEFSLSFYKENDGWGTDISFDMDSIALLICGVALTVYGIYCIYAFYKDKEIEMAYYVTFGVIAVILAFYPLGVFFKAMAKHKPFLDNQDYLYIGIVGILMIAYLIFSYLSDYRKNKSN